MMMTLGFFVFDLRTTPYDQVQRQTGWRLPSQSPINHRPVYQFIGPDEDTLTLSGSVYTEVTGGRVSLDLLRVMAEQGKAWPLIEGSGRMYGFWSITSISETSSLLLRDGVPQKIEFSISLVRVDQKRLDLLGTATNAALLSATGLLAGPLNKARNVINKVIPQL